MSDFLRDVASSPRLYPQKYDLSQDAIYFVSAREVEYRAASFLDERMFAAPVRGEWVPFVDIESLVQRSSSSLPVHFIFHTGHVGSTLLSRLLDQTGQVLGLREPLPLRTLAEAYDNQRDSPSDVAQVRRRLEAFLRLWSRGFSSTRHVVIKATSTAGRLAPELLAARPNARAIYLNLRPESYIATLLAGANAMTDLRGFGRERLSRLERLLGPHDLSLDSLSIGELAATAWLTERLTEDVAIVAGDTRVLALDFDSMLGELPATLARVLRHVGIEESVGYLESISSSPILQRYSKAPEQFAYSVQMRAQLLAQARREHGSDLRKGIDLLGRFAAKDGRVAALL